MPNTQSTPTKNELKTKKVYQLANTATIVKIVVVGIAFHLAAIMSIFDIYFKSPLSHGQLPVDPINPPAKRLVFIIGDGLRADKCFFSDPKTGPRAPFLHSQAMSHGSFGISHTRVPTESRPGHVAMLAGFYEDPSAITKGWKENPVDYDHLVKWARWSFIFGAPEIMSLFPGVRVTASAYSESMVDFGLGNKVLDQDKWPFDRLHELFSKASGDLELNDRLRSDQVFFMLHLLGHDTNGHAYGPHSSEYAENTRFIDGKIKELTKTFEDFYNDDKTVFVFTADHGMSDGRSHGDGDPDNTRTPLIVWGAGVAGPIKAAAISTDPYILHWGSLAQFARKDIRQADLTPLVSTLLGITIPVQSEGHLPVDYLASNKFKLPALIRNCKQLLENYRVKEEAEVKKHKIRFWPFKIDYSEARSRLDTVTNIEECQNLMKNIADGISYLNTYDQTLLFTLITLGFIGWISFGVLSLVKFYTPFGRFYSDQTSLNDRSNLIPLGLLSVLTGILYGRSAPAHYYLYAFFPIWFLKHILQSRDLFSILWAQSNLIFDNESIKILTRYILITEFIVAAYFDRRVMSALYGLGVLGSPYSLYEKILSVFTLLPPIKEPNKLLYVFGAGAGFSVLLHEGLYLQCFIQTIALTSALYADYSLEVKQGLSLFSQVVNWLIFSTSFFMFQRKHGSSLLRVFSMLLPALTLLSVSYEVAFFTVFYLYLTKWNQQQAMKKERTNYWIQFSDLLITAQFISAINLAFFGTGNIASLSSFSLPSVYRLLTAFKPFTMAALLIVKQIIPLILLSTAFVHTAKQCSLEPFSLILLAMSLIDLISIHFFFLVTNIGSWLEIGMGISRFIISCVFIPLGLGMWGLGKILN